VSTVSIETPEAYILAKQMEKELKGKEIYDVELKGYAKLQRIGCINKNISDYDQLVKSKIVSITSRGVAILIKIDRPLNLLLAPEYGGRILYHSKNSPIPDKFHLKLNFIDSTVLTVALTGLGGIQIMSDENLNSSYVYKRDFSKVPSPLSKEFTLQSFSKGLTERNVNVKAVLVGKEALVVGLSNNAFQDIIYRARIHPKRKASSILDKEKQNLFGSIKFVVDERVKSGGKNQFMDLYGNQGRYTSAMGPNMKGQLCRNCNTAIKTITIGGGQVYFCPKCQI
jgi:formamidopyrimidine-DNA glycosylase